MIAQTEDAQTGVSVLLGRVWVWVGIVQGVWIEFGESGIVMAQSRRGANQFSSPSNCPYL